MNKHFIVVPKDIRYIGERDENGNPKWDYNLDDYNFPHILNKKLTGCGFTEYCIRNHQNIILVSPRKFLLENKEEQHIGEVYYARNDLEVSSDFEGTVGKGNKGSDKEDIRGLSEKKEIVSKEIIESTVVENLERFKKNLMDAYANRDLSKPFKILVTYDSFRHVKDALKHYKHDFMGNEVESDIFDQFQVVVDEFQSIFIDSRFKSSTEIELLDNLKDVQRVCYVSATPILEKYLDRLDEFKNLPYYELDWETDQPGRTKKPIIEVKFTTSLTKSASQVISSYLSGKYETRINSETGELIESKEAALFMNSVKGICQAIRSNRLHLDQCNVLCADTKENRRDVRNAFNEVIKREYEEKKEEGLLEKGEKIKLIGKSTKVIGKIPVKGESHKLFTLCTRTVYLGADFYSTNARSFVFSDSNIECLSVDISMDLEQILGRQRLDENPWKNSATMYIKTTTESKRRTREDFNKYIENKMNETKTLLNIFDSGTKTEDAKRILATRYQTLARVNNYIFDYVAVTRIKNEQTGETVKLQPVFNNLVLVSEERAFDVQQVDYKDRFTVFNSLNDQQLDSISDKVNSIFETINGIRGVERKLRALVEFSELKDTTEKEVGDLLELLPGKYKDYYNLIGPDKIKACGYKESEIKKEWRKTVSNGEVKESVVEEIYKTFTIGKKYSNADIKSSLSSLYSKMGYKKSAKASDLELLYILRSVKFKNDKGDIVNGQEIVGKR